VIPATPQTSPRPLAHPVNDARDASRVSATVATLEIPSPRPRTRRTLSLQGAGRREPCTPPRSSVSRGCK
jgi:hypothetical protein